jgi:trans-aconitate methyltransferase
MNKDWNPNSYQKQCNFVYGYGKDLVTLVGPVEGKRILDIGCGSAVLTDSLAQAGALVTGIDGSPDMVAKAKSQFPQLDIRLCDALDLSFENEFDAAFSNAVFHWIEKAKQPVLLGNIARSLKKGGLLVAEMGGLGCAQIVHSALAKAFSNHGLSYVHPHYFPSIGEYSILLEQAGLLVTYANLFDRPTKMEGKDGLHNWISMFVTAPFTGLERDLQSEIIGEAEESARAQLFDGQDWIIDYVRLRFSAEKR